MKIQKRIPLFYYVVTWLLFCYQLGLGLRVRVKVSISALCTYVRNYTVSGKMEPAVFQI